MLQFRSRPIAEHAEVPLADEGQLETIIDRFSARSGEEDAVYVVSVGSMREPTVREPQLAEIVSLAESRGSRVVGREICHLGEANPRTLLGKGAAEAIALRAREHGATMLVIDAELTPSQTRNLEDVARMPICDREAVILDVFARHARTRRAQIQVEVARLEFLRPRIRGVGLDMDQQTGGNRNARGPGETASELLARKIDRRTGELKKVLRRIETSAETQRKHRSEAKRIALVGYTNAGKTSLMNALTSAGLSARDMPFETLDTTSRALTRHGGDVILSDTVGFIRRLPERLLASFESTLAEAKDASLLVIVVDAADGEREMHLRTTLELLDRIGAGDIPRLVVWNKVDRLDAEPPSRTFERWSEGLPWSALSTTDPDGVRRLQDLLFRTIHREEEELTTFVPYAANELLSFVFAKCRVLESQATDRGIHVRVHGPASALRRIRSDAKLARKELGAKEIGR